jgi:hypothetical protein
VDFGREYCSLVKANHNCWRKDSESPYDELLARPTAAPQSMDRASSGGLGRLDSLPVELFTNILESLDFQSLSVFSRASVRANNVVQALPAYEEVMQHARGALSVLAETRLLAHHSAASLCVALRSRRCAGCGAFGGFLFLPTCERACVECLSRKLTFRLGVPDDIMTYFGLTEDQLTASIPPLQALFGNYTAEPQRMGDRVVELCNPGPMVSVRQARDLALRLGVCANPAETWRFNEPNVYSAWAEDSVPRSRHPLSMPSTIVKHMLPQGHMFEVYSHGPSHVRFPFLRADRRVDRGRWCRGCMRTRSDFMMDKLPREVEEALGKNAFGGCVATHITAMASRVWAEEEFMAHVKHCYGAGVMASRWSGVHGEMKRLGFRPRRMAPVRHIDPDTYQPLPKWQRDDEYGYDALETKEHRQYAGDLAEDEPPVRISYIMAKPKLALTYGRRPKK